MEPKGSLPHSQDPATCHYPEPDDYISPAYILRKILFNIILPCTCTCGPGQGSRYIGTRYGLDGPGIEPLWGRDFPHPSRRAMGLTQPPIQWVPSLFPGGKAAGAWR